MAVGKRVLVVGLSLALASCGGGSGQGASVRSLVDTATNLEMTNVVASENRVRIGCSGTVCESSEGAGDYGLASKHAEWLLAPSDTGRAEGTSLSETGSGTYSRARRLGRYSGFYAIGFFRDDRMYRGGWSAALGSSEGKPRGSARWAGNMAGFETRGGIRLDGRSTMTFSLADNTVEVRLSDIRGPGYRGDSEYYWLDVPVHDDGSFFDRGRGDMYLDGNFYGPDAEESAGIFEIDFISGGWFASKE